MSRKEAGGSASASDTGGFPVLPSEPPSGERPATEEPRSQLRIAAILFAGGGLGAVPADLLHEPAHPATVYLLPLMALLSGAACWLLAGRLPARSLHVIAVIATVEVALSVAFADPVFAIYFMFVAIFAAYVFTDRRAIVLHVGFAAFAAASPIIYDPDRAREAVIQTMVLVPSLVLAAGAVAFLRERLAASERSYRTLSERDPMTGVGNYRMLATRMPRELALARRHGRPLSLLWVDLDNFKSVNDRFGHQRGDAVLRAVAAAMAAEIRASDFVVRQGGDEFGIVAVEAEPRTANALGERLRDAIAAVEVDGTPMRASIGIASHPGDGETLDALIAAADARLRRAKADRPRRGPSPAEPTPAAAGDQ